MRTFCIFVRKSLQIKIKEERERESMKQKDTYQPSEINARRRLFEKMNPRISYLLECACSICCRRF